MGRWVVTGSWLFWPVGRMSIAAKLSNSKREMPRIPHLTLMFLCNPPHSMLLVLSLGCVRVAEWASVFPVARVGDSTRNRWLPESASAREIELRERSGTFIARWQGATWRVAWPTQLLSRALASRVARTIMPGLRCTTCSCSLPTMTIKRMVCIVDARTCIPPERVVPLSGWETTTYLAYIPSGKRQSSRLYQQLSDHLRWGYTRCVLCVHTASNVRR